MDHIFVADGGDAVWVGSAKNPKKEARKIGVMQRVVGGSAAPAQAAASIVFQQSCPSKRARQIEARAQDLLAHSRVFQNWFACPVQTAVDAVQQAMAEN
ncbi:MAG: hypothetical protein ACTSX7_13470 [Alphaproteobacteria bacterium]